MLRSSVVTALVALSMLGSGSQAVVPAAGVEQGSRGAPESRYDWHVLTPGPEQIKLKTEPSGRVQLRGRNPLDLPIQDFNRRQVFVDRRTEPTVNQTVCATWVSQSQESIQQGLAVRVVGGPGERQRAVTLTKNTIAGYYWVFNLLSWDTRRSGDPWRFVGQFDMSDVVVRDDHWVPLPWRACLSVHGRTVAFKVWLPDREPEPSWQDPTHTRRAVLPARFVLRGQPGWYVGHLPAGQTTEYADLVD